MLRFWITFSFLFVTAVLGQCPNQQGTIKYQAGLKEIPYMVSIQSSEKGVQPFQHVAGGAIIAPMWVITSALTFTNNIPEGPLRVQAGFVNFKTPGANMQTISVNETFKHPKYRGAYAVHDLALLKLTRPLQLNDFIKPVLLPFTIQTPIGLTTLSRWNHVARNVEASNNLEYLHLPLISHDECLDSLPVSNPSLSELYNCCTLPYVNLKTCEKDLGSPLVQDGRLVGVMSWGASICDRDCISFVYTRIDSELSFIRSVTGMEIG